MKLKRNQYNLNMDWMERSALTALTEHESLRLKQLLPKDVPSNLFSYHLQKLQTTGLVERSHGLYSLTPKGKQLAGQINVDTGRIRLQSKIIAMFYITNNLGQVALFRWKRQPYYGYASLPYGKFDFGKSLQENVRDEVRTGDCFWGSLDDRKLKYFPGISEVTEMANSKKPANLRDLRYDLS